MQLRRLLVLGLACSPAIAAACSDNGEATLQTASDGGPSFDATGDGASPARDAGADSPPPPVDGSGPVDSGLDGLPPIDAAGLDAGPPPPGTQIAQGFDVLWTVTSDGFAVYSDGGTLLARPVAGGAAQTIANGLNGPTEILAFGKAVFVWTNIPGSNVASLGVWTNSAGYHSASNASYAGLGAASDDGTRVLFTSNAGAGTAGDVVASGADLAAPVTVASNVALRDASGCFPRLDFGGSSALLLSCASGTDAGATGATLSAFSGASFTKKDLVTSARVGPVLLQRDAAGTKTFTVQLDGSGVVAPVDGSPTVKIDSSVFLGYMTQDGTAVVYGVNGGELRRNASTGGTPLKLASGVTGFFLGKPLSPTGNSLYVWSNTQANGLTDLYVANAAAPAALATLTTTPNAALPSTPFTADGAHALWFAPITIVTQLGTLHATPTAGGATADLGQNVTTDYALGGSKVAFMDDATGTTFSSKGNLEVVDLAASSTPTRVVTGADESWFPSPDGKKLVYTWSTAPYQGVWAVDAP